MKLFGFFWVKYLAAREIHLKVNKWGVWGSNLGPACIMHYPLPSELSYRVHFYLLRLNRFYLITYLNNIIKIQ